MVRPFESLAPPSHRARPARCSTNWVKGDMVLDGLLSAHATFGFTEKI